MKEKLLDKDTIDAYHSYVQSQIRSDLNSIALGPGRLPTRVAQGLLGLGFCCLLVGILLIALRMQHVYFWDWDVQFVGPFFIILFLASLTGATYLCMIATRRANRYRRELYFQPLGDYGISAVHKDDLVTKHEMRHDLKSGTTPHKNVMPREEAYSKMNLSRDGHHNKGYHHGPGDPHRGQRGHAQQGRRPDDRDKRRPPDARRGPPTSGDRYRPDGPRGPRPEGDYRRGPPRDDRRRPPDGPRRPDDQRGPDDRRGPDYRRGPDDRPGPDYRRGPDDRPGPDYRRGPDDRPGPDYRRGPDDRPGPDYRRGGPEDRRGPDDPRRPEGEYRRPPPEGHDPREGFRNGRGGPPQDDRRPRGVPHFRERSPDDGESKIDLGGDRSSESIL